MWTIYKLWKINEHTILKLWTLIKNIIERTHKFPYNILFTFLMDRGRAPNGIGHLMILHFCWTIFGNKITYWKKWPSRLRVKLIFKHLLVIIKGHNEGFVSMINWFPQRTGPNKNSKSHTAPTGSEWFILCQVPTCEIQWWLRSSATAASSCQWTASVANVVTPKMNPPDTVRELCTYGRGMT